MMRRLIQMGALGLAMILAVSCGASENKNPAGGPMGQAPQTKAQDASTTAAMPEAPGGGWTGQVIETMNAGGYTYVQVDAGGERVWAAGPPVDVKVGDTVHVSDGMLMTNFESKSLQRTFPEIYFVGGIHVGGMPESGAGAPAGVMEQMPPGHPDISGMLPEGHVNIGEEQAPQMPDMPEGHPDISAMMAAHPDPSKSEGGEAKALDFSGIAKPEGGHTVAEVYEKKAALLDKEVTLRGKVVKFNEKILGKNWIHVRDGSGGEGTSDLTITTDGKAAVGDMVLVKGMLRANRDFGFGYKYDLLIENAKVTVEKAVEKKSDQ